MAVSKNVYELAQERLELIFKEFDTICVSFSGEGQWRIAELVHRLHPA
jgi:predicted phosphoadenosine phosphosulfate sulfurtransferase